MPFWEETQGLLESLCCERFLLSLMDCATMFMLPRAICHVVGVQIHELLRGKSFLYQFHDEVYV